MQFVAAKLLKGSPVDCIAVPLEMNTMVFSCILLLWGHRDAVWVAGSNCFVIIARERDQLNNVASRALTWHVILVLGISGIRDITQKGSSGVLRLPPETRGGSYPNA